jgi:catechol 2,3-dioxygenase-like lactoylglutathione lyase family enzyme
LGFKKGVLGMSYLKALSIDHANINVNNLDESVDFYSTLFGFELKKDQPEQNSKIIGNDAVKLCLYENPEMVYTKGINHIGFHIQNFDEVVEKCKTMNISMPYGVIQWESSRSVYILDPSGYELELSEVQGGGL